jgi:hypothetical protein
MAKLEAYDDLNTRAIGLAGGLSILIIIVLVLAVQAIYFAYDSMEFDAKVLTAKTPQATRELNRQQRALQSITFGPDGKLASIPIDRAIQLQAEGLAAGSLPFAPELPTPKKEDVGESRTNR